MSDYTLEELQELGGGAGTLEGLVHRYYDTRKRLDPNWRHSSRYIESIDYSSEGLEVNLKWAACSQGCCGSEYATEEVTFQELLMTPEEITAEVEQKQRDEAEAKRKEEEAAALKEEADKIERDKAKVIEEQERLKELAVKYPEVLS